MRRHFATLFLVLFAAAAPAAELPPIEASGLINAPPREVWTAWTTGSGLRAWLAPHAEFDLRLGGLMRTHYKPDGVLGDEGTIENRVLAYEPERMLAIQVARAPATFPFPQAVKHMWTVLYLSPAEGERTQLRIVGLGFTDEPESARMREFFQRGNAYTLQQLQKRFER